MTVFWPGMSKDIDEIVSSYEKCMKYYDFSQPQSGKDIYDRETTPMTTMGQCKTQCHH